MKGRRALVLGVLASVLALALAAVLFACSQTPTSVPVRTFERAQRMDVACLQLYAPSDPSNPNSTFVPREPIGRAQGECAPVPTDVDGQGFVKQLFALVTQSTRGELAVVDLSAGRLVDLSRATPGINFLPVGSLPTDVATTPDGKMAFVGSAEPNKAAIYGIPTRRILGDTSGFPRDPAPVTLASWPVCALPQAPGALSVVPRSIALPAAPAADGGAAEGGADGGADAGAADLPDYVLVAVLPGDRTSSAKVVTIDPRPFRRGGLRRTADNKPDFASDHLPGEPATLTDGPILEPGSLAPCPILSAIELVGSSQVPSSVAAGAAWDDGVKYLDGGVDLTCLRPVQADRCGLPACCANNGGDGGVSAEAGTCTTSAPDAGPITLDLGPLDPPRLVSVARDDQTLYIADEGVPFIHVIDMSSPAAPREMPPLVATSLADPSRVVKVRELAVSPPTRDYKRYLYAVDRTEGSILIYDVTDPASPQRTPLVRPHPELNPFQPADRIAFSSPVVAVSFARHDLPLSRISSIPISSAGSGLLCNPNHNLDANPAADLGFYYRANVTDPGQDIGPRRLRGIFAFATLANGQVVTINVDDWDAPCRRPGNMLIATSDITPPEVNTGDIDPYHAPALLVPGRSPPVADPNNLAVTNEAFFPMSAPHSLRSSVLVRDDITTGNQVPHLQGTATVSSNGTILAQSGFGSADTPLLGMSFAFEDPTVHIDQDWTVTYEGALPGFDGLSATLSTRDNYETMVMAQPQARFCTKGVEDAAQGTERSQRISAEIVRAGKTPTARALTDYVQLTEDMLDVSDPYWALNDDIASQCWDPSLTTPAKRQDTCVRTYGAASDQNPQRDFPIIEAYDDHLVLGRFFTNPDGQREVVYKHPSNAAALKLMQCCFHHQARFKVRTGQLWSTIGGAVGGGPGVGFFSHLTTDSAGRCVPSCDPRESLLNGRIPTVPDGVLNTVTLTTDTRDPAVLVTPDRKNDALAMRNPMFTLGILGGKVDAVTKVAKVPARDTVYTFSTRGGFQTLVVSVAGGSISVNPQSMRFIETFGQMAVVDGASQGLVLIDLRAVTVARAPYF